MALTTARSAHDWYVRTRWPAQWAHVVIGEDTEYRQHGGNVQGANLDPGRAMPAWPLSRNGFYRKSKFILTARTAQEVGTFDEAPAARHPARARGAGRRLRLCFAMRWRQIRDRMEKPQAAGARLPGVVTFLPLVARGLHPRPPSPGSA